MPPSPARIFRGLNLLLLVATAWATDPAVLKFQFSPSPASPGYTQVLPDVLYTGERGFGFELGGSATSFHFTARVPREDNYRVTVTLGAASQLDREHPHAVPPSATSSPTPIPRRCAHSAASAVHVAHL